MTPAEHRHAAPAPAVAVDPPTPGAVKQTLRPYLLDRRGRHRPGLWSAGRELPDYPGARTEHRNAHVSRNGLFV